jgi:hypothetical protein
MRYKLPIVIFILSVITVMVPNYFIRTVFEGDIDKMITMQNYFGVIGFLFGLLYFYVLVVYSDSNWIKSIAVIGVLYSLLLIPYRFIVFRTNPTFGYPTYNTLLQYIVTSMLLLAIVTLLFSTIILFVRKIPISLKIYFFISGIVGIMNTPLIYQPLVQMIIRMYEFSTLTTFFTMFSSIGLFMMFFRVYVAYKLIKDKEDSYHEKIIFADLKPDYKY